MVHSKQLGLNKQKQQSNTNTLTKKQKSAAKTQNLDTLKTYIVDNGSVTTKRCNRSQSLLNPLTTVRLCHPAAGGDLDLGAFLFAIHLVLQHLEWIQRMCASVCSRGRLHARPLGWHHSVQNLMLTLMLSRGNGVCIPAQLSRVKAEGGGTMMGKLGWMKGVASYGGFHSK